MAKQPLLTPQQALLYQAFQTLNIGRQSGWGPLGISVMEMLAYLAIYPIENPEAFIPIISDLDVEWQKIHEQKVKSRGN